jgi:hypothetical protein
MTTRRRILWLLLPLALLGTGVGAAVPFFFPGLPDPAVANREQLFRWIITRDLAKESPETCLVLVQRLEEEFRTGVDWDSMDGHITDAQREQLWKNIPLLFRPWLCEKAKVYARLSAVERSKFMDAIFNTLSAWRGADKLQAKPSDNASAQRPNLLSVFFDQVDACKKEAEPDERDRITQFVGALQIRALMM